MNLYKLTEYSASSLYFLCYEWITDAYKYKLCCIRNIQIRENML